MRSQSSSKRPRGFTYTTLLGLDISVLSLQLARHKIITSNVITCTVSEYIYILVITISSIAQNATISSYLAYSRGKTITSLEKRNKHDSQVKQSMQPFLVLSNFHFYICALPIHHIIIYHFPLQSGFCSMDIDRIREKIFSSNHLECVSRQPTIQYLSRQSDKGEYRC